MKNDDTKSYWGIGGLYNTPSSELERSGSNSAPLSLALNMTARSATCLAAASHGPNWNNRQASPQRMTALHEMFKTIVFG
jgi:hypothetical protein